MSQLKLLSTVAAALLLGGCTVATGSPDWDERFGDSVRGLQAQQLIDAQAPARNAQTTPATAGRTTRDAVDRHGDSYRTPPPTNVINIGVGGGGSGG